MLSDYFDRPPEGCGEPGVPPIGKTIPESITLLLARVNNGDRKALDHLVPLVYQELHRIAEGYLRRESQHHTLQPTALIHEAYLRLAEYGGADYQNRKHFFAVAARVMRQILVDHARRRNAGRRQGAQLKVSLANALAAQSSAMDLVELDQLLTTLGKRSEQQGRIVELRYFAGLSIPETAAALQTSPGTVKRQWRLARAWLYREMRKE